MNTGKKNIAKISICLLAFACVWGVAFADVEVSGSGNTVTIKNKTENLWKLGGARFQTNVPGKWTNANNITTNRYGASLIIRNENGYTDVTVKSSDAADKTALSVIDDPWNNTSATFSYSGNADFNIVKGSELLLLRTGAPGLADDPESYPPIRSIDELKQIVKNPDFYKESYRYPYYDSLGSNGGKYSGGFMDTYIGQTQLHFAIPKGNFTVSGTSTKAVPGDSAKQFYMALGMGQEYLNVDAQWMFAMGSKETFSGTMVDYGETLNGKKIWWSTGDKAVASGNYTNWHVEDISMLDRALYYPHFYPKYAAMLSASADAAIAISKLGGRDVIAKYYVGAYDGRRSPRVINGLFISASFQYGNYDVLARSTNVCWKYALEKSGECGDPYLGLAVMVAMYNLGQWGLMGTAAGLLGQNNIDKIVCDKNARTQFPEGNGDYRGNILKVAQELINASNDFEKGSGAKSELIDFKITLNDLREMYFGTGGTVAKQGDGGLLLHFYDPDAGKDVSAIRQKIWDTLKDAFDVLKVGKGTNDNNTISYRYDFLSAIRTVKAELPYIRNFKENGDPKTLIPQNSTTGCSKEAVNGDDKYPYIDALGVTSSEELCEFAVKVSDDKLCGMVKWTLDYNWGAIWNEAKMVEKILNEKGELVNNPQKINNFKFEITKTMADGFLDKGDGSGKYVWIMAEDAAGNSVVRRETLNFKVKPNFRWAGVFDALPQSDGYPDSIKVEIKGLDVLKGLSPKYSYRWNSDTGAITSGFSEAGDILKIKLSKPLTEGAGSGTFYVEYNDPEEGKVKTSVALKDSCGPAILKARFNSYPEGDKSKPDSLKVTFTENVKVASGKERFIVFRDTTKKPVKEDVFSVDSVRKLKDDEYIFFYKSDVVAPNRKLSYTHVRINDTTRISDEVGNAPFKDNKWIELEDGTITKKKLKIEITNAEYLDTNKTADGFIDLIRVEFKFTSDTIKDPYKDSKYLKSFKEMFEGKNRIKLNDDRHFTIGKINFISENLLEIPVSQDTSKFRELEPTGSGSIPYYAPKTDVDDKKDILSFNGDDITVDKDFDVSVPKEVKIKDKIAPVITIAYYYYWNVDGGEKDVIDTLVVKFSEEVNGGDIRSLNPEIFNVISPRNGDNIYSPKFGVRKSEHPGLNGDKKTAKFFIEYFEGDDFIVPGDSIQIVGGHGISDNSGNLQAGGTNTVFAPIAVGSLHSTYEITIVPNPYNNSSPQWNGAIDYYGSKNDDGDLVQNATNVAIIAKPKGVREGGEKEIVSSSVTIIDQLGNVVESGRGFNRGQRGAWIWTWDGKNTKKRAVGAGIYHAIITINDGETQKYSRKIGIKN